ncbi:hypothetical protein [Streptomyces griseocarneus]|uniref:hypothetical protein n=1 Tax=Streptomyces griseocarneus TaxID=51201 RepID=UPI00167C49FC|nr:hypothetical protein [Streptomyces griseocarneus]MBZ6477904.1 hypothetical protein [Streptomyces griseocarneus]GHG54329.1 hypothetical protein GCM10018779_17200 [Streptomyces griseocarneus]
MAGEPEEPTEINAVRVGDSGELEFFDGQKWLPYVDLPDDDPGPLGVAFRGDTS